ncbi:MAG: STAS domain-containing protein [Pseudonocardiaceae bacterium]
MTRAADADDALTITPSTITPSTITPGTDRPGARLIGEVDLATAPALQAALDRLVEGGGDVHLDLAELRFVDLSGVAVLVAAAAQLAPDRALVLHDPPPALSQILEHVWDGAARIRVEIS